MELNPDLFYTGPHEALYVSRPDGSINDDALAAQIDLQLKFTDLLSHWEPKRPWPFNEAASKYIVSLEASKWLY